MRARKIACTKTLWQTDCVTTRRTGLREQKKHATREALSSAALRLALEHGPDNVRVDDIAEAAGVSPRTYNNYFASREQAIVAAVTAERESRVAAAVAARTDNPLSEAVTEAVVEQFTGQNAMGPNAMLMISSYPPLREAYISTAAMMEPSLARAIGDRVLTGDLAAVLAACVAAAIRVALSRWITFSATGLAVVGGTLPDLLRECLAPLAPALDAAEEGTP